jgi:predicted  nucleic acid-binding Zn-ribbon protein
MDTQEILNKIAKLKNAIQSESDADVKATYQKKVDALEKQIAEAEQKVEKVEAKASADEKKDLSEAEQKIKKLEAALSSESDPDVKERYQKKIKQLKETLQGVKEEIKEEKKEIAEQKKDIKEAVKEIKSVDKSVRKVAIKKVATKISERKETVKKKSKRKDKLKSIVSELDALINKNKKLKSKYTAEYKGTGKTTDKKRDAGRSAKPFGYRFVGKHDYRVPTEAQVRKGLKRGTIDYEARPNRSDVYPKRTVKLADGGMMADGGKVDARTYLHINKKIDSDIYPLIDDGYYVKLSKHKEVFLGGQILESGMTKTKAINFAKDLMSRWNIPDENLIIDEEYRVDQFADGGMMAHGGKTQGYDDREDERLAMKYGRMGSKDLDSTRSRRDDARFEERGKMADGGMMAKGGKVKKKPSKKVGKSIQDKHRFAKPAGWRWKEEAVTKKIIERKQLSMSPMKKMRDKYPDYVYYEDRLNKADEHPTRSSKDSI